MVDIKEEKEKLANAGTPANGIDCADPLNKPVTSKGERWYNWILYRGINYWLNLGMSLVIADYFMHLGGRHFVTKTARSMSMGSKAAERNWKVGIEQLFLNSGGWLLLVPLKIAEDHKRLIVHSLNKDLFGIKQVNADGRELGPEEIYIEKEQPKQTWLRAFARRSLATSATIVFGIGLDHAAPKKLDQPIAVDGKQISSIGGKQRFTDFMVKVSNRALNSGYIPGGRNLAKQEWVQRYLSMAALDVINTEITASVMKWTNGAEHKPLPQDQCADPTAPKKSTSFTEQVSADKKSVVSPRPKKDYASAVQKPADSAEVTLGA